MKTKEKDPTYYLQKYQISRESLHSANPGINVEDVIFRELLFRLVENIPREKILKLFTLKVLDPKLPECIAFMRGLETQSHPDSYKLRSLEEQELIQYELSITI